jgi:hypothetical protein
MLAKFRSGVTFANVVSLMALFLAFGGGAYALTIPRKSVGARQLKHNAVTGSKVRKGAVTSSEVRNRSLLAEDFKAEQLPTGPSGPRGAPGPAGPKGATGAPGSPGPTAGATESGGWEPLGNPEFPFFRYGHDHHDHNQQAPGHRICRQRRRGVRERHLHTIVGSIPRRTADCWVR